MEYSIENIEILISNKLNEALTKFKNREVKIIDIGIFPWHKSIEISFLFTDDEIEDKEDIASWENYNFYNIAEGEWVEAEPIANEMNVIYEKNYKADKIFNDFAQAINSEKVIKILREMKLSNDFIIQILDPDDSSKGNYIKKLKL